MMPWWALRKGPGYKDGPNTYMEAFNADDGCEECGQSYYEGGHHVRWYKRLDSLVWNHNTEEAILTYSEVAEIAGNQAIDYTGESDTVTIKDSEYENLMRHLEEYVEDFNEL